LHYHPLSSYSRKTAIGIGLRADRVELAQLDLEAGALKNASFRAMNPFGKMPVLEIAGEPPIFESTSILEYLEERGPKKLLPNGHERRARHFDRLGDLYLLEPIGEYFWDKRAEVREQAEKTTALAWQIWERELADGRLFLCGDEITLADLGAAVAGHYARTEELPVPHAIARYIDRLEENAVIAASRDAAMPYVAATRARRIGTATR
jgi:glutathione S-transferase